MPVYLQILLLIVSFIVIVAVVMYLGGLSVRTACFKIIAEMEEAGAFREARAIDIQDERKNIFRVGTRNIRPRALNVLIAEKIVIKAGNGKYYLDKDQLSRMKAHLKK
jgi:hypothetical protein